MDDAGLLQLLDLVRRDLSARDAHLEIGGEAPSDPRALWVSTGHHRRLVALFDEPPDDPVRVRERLEGLAEAFSSSFASPIPSTIPPRAATAALRQELEGLCQRAGARAAVIVDTSSPVVWSGYPASLGDAVEPLLVLAERGQAPEGADDNLRRDAGWAIILGRQTVSSGASTMSLHLVSRDTGRGAMLRGLAGSYMLALVFDAQFSEIRAHGAVERSRDRLERLIAAMPPFDPPPDDGKVISLHRS